jgi:hypothetical protein
MQVTQLSADLRAANTQLGLLSAKIQVGVRQNLAQYSKCNLVHAADYYRATGSNHY